MTGHSRMIFFIVMMFIATGSIIVFYETSDTMTANVVVESDTHSIGLANPRITQVAVMDMYESKAERVEFEVRGGSQPVSIEGMSVRVRTTRFDSRYDAQTK